MKSGPIVAIPFALLSLVAACTSGSSSASVTVQETPSSTTSAASATTTTTADLTNNPTVPQTDSNGALVGTLLDGTEYSVIIEPSRPNEAIGGVTAVIAAELGDVSAFLEVSVEPGTVGDSSWEGDTYLLPIGDWTVRISGVAPDERELRQAVESIDGQESAGLPVLKLEPPLRWASDIETETVMQVQYSTFSVRRGCQTLAATCSVGHAVQLTNVEASDDDFLFLESRAPRPTTDAWFVDPGPLVPRGGHQVMWTGEEMIVWGGSVADTPPNLVDGAAFGPDTSTWRSLAAAAVEAPQQTAAVWAGDRMIVVSGDSTLAYEADRDTWETIGDGLDLSSELHIRWTGSTVAVWTANGISTFTPTTGMWTQLPDPGFGGPGRWEGHLLSASGGLVAVGLDAPVCSGRLAARWNGVEWDPVPEVDLTNGELADCGLANQSAVIDGQLIFWEDRAHPTMAFDFRTDRWEKVDTIPLSGTEGASGAIEVGSGILVPQGTEAAWLPSVDASWIMLDMPGQGSDLDMIWTGDVVVMWGSTCCYGAGDDPFSIDAWRWTMLGP
jgi:hypothetical protein